MERLVTLASGYERDFNALQDAAITLTPYATAYRYPGETPEFNPSRGEFDEAMDAATRVLSFVLALLPEAT